MEVARLGGSRSLLGTEAMVGSRKGDQVSLTFVIPVRHWKNASNWDALKTNLQQTVRSVALQTNRDWRGVVVANHGSDLPELPPGFVVEFVDFPPNAIHERGDATQEDFYNAFKLDKGRRVLAGMLRARRTEHFMIVDDDDFVSSALTQFVSERPGKPGWVVRTGYFWTPGGRFIYSHSDFDRYCGTSLIVNASLYELPDTLEAASDEYMMSMLGSHIEVKEKLQAKGIVLDTLPFHGAVYRIGHAGAHSGSNSVLHTAFFHERKLKGPVALMRSAMQLRFYGKKQRAEFGLS